MQTQIVQLSFLGAACVSLLGAAAGLSRGLGHRLWVQVLLGFAVATILVQGLMFWSF